MCNFNAAVAAGGRYTKTLSDPCSAAKIKKQEVCESGSENSRTTNQWCYKDGCDRKAGPCREGPGDITNGGFDDSDVDWDQFN